MTTTSQMFSVFETQTLSGKSRFVILDYGYQTSRHPKFSSRERADRYVEQATSDENLVRLATETLREANAFRASIGLPAIAA